MYARASSISLLGLAVVGWLALPANPARAESRRIIDEVSTGGSHPAPPPRIPPLASLVLGQLPLPPLTVIADASGSRDTTGDVIASYNFDFGDSTPVVTVLAPVASTQHTYAAAGTYTVTVTVIDSEGDASGPVASPITVLAPDFPPVASLIVAQLASPAFTVNADASGSTDTDATPIASYAFDFGDGTPPVVTAAPVATAQHTYAAAAHYTVTVLVTDTGNLVSSRVSAGIDVAAPDLPPVASLTLSQPATPLLTVNADASGSTDTDVTPIASYRFDFGDGSAAVTTTAPVATAQHTYASPGNHTVTVTATDTGNQTSTPVSATIYVNPASIVLERGVATSSDDAEETSDGSVHLSGTDLDFGAPSQVVGMRWLGINIPPGSVITRAYIQFKAQMSQNDNAVLTIHAQAADSSGTLAIANYNLSSRPLTSDTVSWTPPAWNSGNAGAAQRTPDLSAIVQEVVNRPGWLNGFSLAMFISGSGDRTAWSDDGGYSNGPLIHIEYLPPEAPPVAVLNVVQVQPTPLTISADASGSSDNDATPIAGYHFDFGDGTTVDTTPPNTIVQHAYAAEGTYTVTLTVTDTGNSASTPVTAPVSVTSAGGAQIAVYVGYYDTHHAVHTQPKPDPWRGSANTTFVGQQDNQQNDPPGGGWDTSCLRIDNLTNNTLSNVAVSVTVGTHHYSLWGTNSIQPGWHLVLAQTQFENFDGSDLNTEGCYSCDPTLCVTLISPAIPDIHVTIGGVAADYVDPRQILNTHGVDNSGCPYVGGQLPQTRYDESENWVRIYANSGQGLRAVPTGPGDAAATPTPVAAAAPRVVSLSAPAPNPVRGEFNLRFAIAHHGPVRLAIYDLAGRLVRTAVDGVMDPGEYNFRTDLGHGHPGVYFVRLWTPEVSRFEKLLLVN